MSDKEVRKPKNSVWPCHRNKNCMSNNFRDLSNKRSTISATSQTLSYALPLLCLCVLSLLVLFSAASSSCTLCPFFTYFSAHAWFLPSCNLSLHVATMVWPFPPILALSLTADCWQRDADWSLFISEHVSHRSLTGLCIDCLGKFPTFGPMSSAIISGVMWHK